MQNNQILPNNQQGVQPFDIENLQNNEPAQQTNLSKNVPLKAGAFFGVGNAVGGYLSNAILPKDKLVFPYGVLTNHLFYQKRN